MDITEIRQELIEIMRGLRDVEYRRTEPIESAIYFLEQAHVSIPMACYHIGCQAGEICAYVFHGLPALDEKGKYLYPVSGRLGELAGELSKLADEEGRE